MKKLITTIILFFILTIPVSAFYYDNTLVNLWNNRKDLQKAFPGDPLNNIKLEKWAKERGWKETPELFNYYPEKAIVEKIIDNKTSNRIATLEKQIQELTVKISQLQNNQGGQTTVIQQVPTEGTWRNCLINNNGGGVVCETTDADWPVFDNGHFNIKILTK